MQYRREIDGLRALAILPVILFHGGFQWFSGGFVGVDVFFVISGYLITSIILAQKKAGTFTLAGFYERRARRILPALFFVLAVSMVLAWLWLLPEDMKQFARSEVAISAFGSNILFFLTAGYFDTASEFKPLLHTWSLAVEEQYYLFFPLLIMATWRYGMRILVVICVVFFVASLALAQWEAVPYPTFTFYLLPTRVWELLIGALLAMYLFGREEGPSPQWYSQPAVAQCGSGVGLGLILVAVFALDASTPFPSVYALLPTVGAVCIILFASAQNVVGKALGSKWLVGIGLISYSAYLWHQPLFAFARLRSLVEPSDALFAGLSVATLPLAYLTWRFVERPFRQAGTVSTRQLVAFSIVGTLSILAFGVAGHLTGGFPSRYTSEVLALAKAAQQHRERPPACLAVHGKPDVLSAACALGSAGPASGVLLGDSHADALAVALGEALEKKNLDFKDASFPGCSPIINLYRAKSDDVRCFDYNQEVLGELKARPEFKYVVILARWTMGLDGNGENLSHAGKNGNGFDNEEGGVEYLLHPKDPVLVGVDKAAFEFQERQFVRRRHVDTVLEHLKANKTVVLIYPVPETGWDVPTYLSKKVLFDHASLKAADGSTSYAVYKKRNKEAIGILDSIGEHKNLIRVRPDELLCGTYVKERCVTHLSGVPLYFDDDHFSTAGARLLAAQVLRQLEAKL